MIGCYAPSGQARGGLEFNIGWPSGQSNHRSARIFLQSLTGIVGTTGWGTGSVAGFRGLFSSVRVAVRDRFSRGASAKADPSQAPPGAPPVLLFSGGRTLPANRSFGRKARSRTEGRPRGGSRCPRSPNRRTTPYHGTGDPGPLLFGDDDSTHLDLVRLGPEVCELKSGFHVAEPAARSLVY